jgi:hypothetical protein
MAVSWSTAGKIVTTTSAKRSATQKRFGQKCVRLSRGDLKSVAVRYAWLLVIFQENNGSGLPEVTPQVA